MKNLNVSQCLREAMAAVGRDAPYEAVIGWVAQNRPHAMGYVRDRGDKRVKTLLCQARQQMARPGFAGRGDSAPPAPSNGKAVPPSNGTPSPAPSDALTLDCLRNVRDLAERRGVGLEALLDDLAVIEEAARRAGGMERLRQGVVALCELTEGVRTMKGAR